GPPAHTRPRVGACRRHLRHRAGVLLSRLPVVRTTFATGPCRTGGTHGGTAAQRTPKRATHWNSSPVARVVEPTTTRRGLLIPDFRGLSGREDSALALEAMS